MTQTLEKNTILQFGTITLKKTNYTESTRPIKGDIIVERGSKWHVDDIYTSNNQTYIVKLMPA